MATITKTLGLLVEDAGRAELQVDYDNVLLRLLAVRIINSHPTLTARVVATSVANPARTATLDGPPAQTTTQAFPGGAAQRLDVTITASGRLDGVFYSFGWLVP